MHEVLVFEAYVVLAISLLSLVVKGYAFVNSLLWSAESYTVVGRLTKAAWVAILGFSVLTLSHFIPLIYFGVLVSAAMAGGLLGDLILLPLLLRWFEMPLRRSAP